MTYDIYRAIEIFRSNKKYWLPTVAESARAVVADYPQISIKADSLRRNYDFISAWKDVVKQKELPPKPVLDQSTIVNPQSAIPNPQSEQSAISIESEVDYLRQIAKQKSKQRENEEKIKYLMKQLEEAERRFEVLSAIKETTERYEIVPELRSSVSESVAVVLASDWHVEERVERDVVNNLNAYTPTIAATRIECFFKNVLRLVERERHNDTVNVLVFWLGGDLMSGYIHEELVESNFLSPIEVVLFLKKHLISGIDFLLKYGNFREIVIPTNYGNHGRTGERLKVSTGAKNSYEYMLYLDLADIYEKRCETRVKFLNAKGEFNFLTVFGKKIRFSHGYHIRYSGGIGGITIPAMKFIATQNRIERADYDCWGHHHQYFTNPFFCQNGSLIGVSAYGRRYGNEKPMQAFFVVNKKRGITVQMPIFAD